MDGDDNEIRPSKDSFVAKCALLVAFVAGDVCLNSQAEYAALSGDRDAEALSQLQVVLFMLSLVLQISTASALFLIACNTFPFQVGLWDVLVLKAPFLRQFLLLQPVYMTLGGIVGGIRLKQVLVHGNPDVWRSLVYSSLSTMHKLVAPWYYAASLRSALSLGHETYYTKDAWIPPRSEARDAGDQACPLQSLWTRWVPLGSVDSFFALEERVVQE